MPKTKMKIGKSASLGTAYVPEKSGSSRPATSFERPMSMPTRMPTMAASAKPPRAGKSVTQASKGDSGFEKNSTSSRPIFSSGGKRRGLHRPLRAAASQTHHKKTGKKKGKNSFIP